MSTFSAISIGRTGAGFTNQWIDTIAHNIANQNTVNAPGEEPFRALRPVAQTLTGGPFAPTGSGVVTGGQVREEGEAARVHDPDHPMADEDGNVTMPVVDMGGQMTDLIIAQRSYQANLRTIESAREAYQSALRLGAH
jgi:flagellar basal-body rod protein FlgC